jgi:hypothetical protein
MQALTLLRHLQDVISCDFLETVLEKTSCKICNSPVPLSLSLSPHQRPWSFTDGKINDVSILKLILWNISWKQLNS